MYLVTVHESHDGVQLTRVMQLAGVSGCRGAKNEVWHLGSQAPSGGWRATRVDVLAA